MNFIWFGMYEHIFILEIRLEEEEKWQSSAASIDLNGKEWGSTPLFIGVEMALDRKISF